MEKVFLVTSFSSFDFESNVKTEAYVNYDTAKERFESLADNIELQLNDLADASFIKNDNYVAGCSIAATCRLWVRLEEVDNTQKTPQPLA